VVFGKQVALEPFASVAYVNLHTSSVNEQGGAAALAGESGSTNSTFTTVGMRGAIDFALGNKTVVTASGTLGWRHAFRNVVPTSTLAFAGGSPFVVAGVPIARNAALVEAGLDFQITPSASHGVAYSGQFGGGTTSQSVRGTLKMRF
jgi:fibronectin-binding autotransporter adhesin